MMRTSTSIQIEGQKETKKIGIAKVRTAGLLLSALLSLGFTSHASTYIAQTSGRFNEENVWKPSYPGNIISASDTVIIANNVKLNVDVIVKGTMIVRNQASLTGEKNLVVLENGLLMNNGITIVDAITNRGTIFNKHIMETAKDFINTGRVLNNESMVVGNIMDNTGTLTGNGGQLIANAKFVNSKTGQISGNVDVCSGNFMNVDGGHIDSTYMSFCGQRIFNSVFLTASLKKESVVLNLLNSQNKHFKEYTVEKSTDGKNYTALATVKAGDVKDSNEPFKFTDNEVASSNTIFYRMKLVQDDGSEKVIPAVEVGNIMASKMSAMGNHQ